jgi:hypothetical protein
VTVEIDTAARVVERRRGIVLCVMHGIDISARLKGSPTIATAIVPTALDAA